jgi:hypothetical protein
MSNVRSEPLKDGQTASQAAPVRASPAHSRPRVGFLRPAHIERAFVAMLYIVVAVFVLLSVVGTFYGWRGLTAPLTSPWTIIADIRAAPVLFAIASGIQGALSLTQYGARQFARHNRRWWLVYLVALTFSVYYNVLAYWAPLAGFMGWYLAASLIVGGDVLPEIVAIKHE